jgi:endonuclease III
MGEPGAAPSRTPIPDLVAKLEPFYGLLPSPPRDPFRYYVWDALSVQTTPPRRDAAYAALQKIPALTPDAMWRIARGKLEAAVALAGAYQEQRIRALLTGAQIFRRHPQLPAAIADRLLRARRAVALLPTLGDGSAHRMLLFGGGHCVLPIDRDVARLLRRLGRWPETGESAARPFARRIVQRLLPADAEAVRHVTLYLRHHAQHTCAEEPHCAICPIATDCPSRRTP